MNRLIPAGFLSAALILAACGGGQNLFGSAPPAASDQDIIMPGRWILTAPNAPSCGMNFSGIPGKNEGTITPEGGCPERFFTSQHWALDKDMLTINDDQNNPLATLTFANGQFEGKSTSDTPVTLAR
jgi:hypothetical protein